MNFDALAGPIEPRLRQIALKYHHRYSFADAEDLFSVMKVFLWERFRENALVGKTESYIVQSCYFFLRNYLRKMQDAKEPVSLAEPVQGDEGETRLEDLIPAEELDPEREIEGSDLYEKIMKNGFSPLEKTIIELLCAGFTVREVGRTLNISHAMVIKHKKHITQRIEEEYSTYLA